MQNIIPPGKLNLLILTGFVIILGIVYTTLNVQLFITSSLITLTFVYTFFLYLKKLNLNALSSLDNILIASVVLVFVNVTISGFGNFNYYKKAIMYISTLMLMVCSIKYHINKKTVFFVELINFLIAVIYLLTYKQGFNDFEGEVLLTLNFSNPNLAGMFLLNTLLYIIIPVSIIHKSTKFSTLILLLVIIVPLFLSLNGLLVLTGCRSVLIAIAVFLGLTLFDFLFADKFRLKKWMMSFIAAAPFIFVFIYIVFASSITFDVSFGLENAGKTALTRMKIWLPIVSDFFHYLPFGDYYGISNGTGFSQLHNTHLDIFASYGIIPLILYVVLLSKVLWQSYRNATSRFQRVSLYAFIACIVVGTFEASFVAGSGGLFILTNGFVLLANSQINENFTGKLRL